MSDGATRDWPATARLFLKAGQLRLDAGRKGFEFHPRNGLWRALVDAVVNDDVPPDLLPFLDWHPRGFKASRTEHHVGIRLPGALEVRLRFRSVDGTWHRAGWPDVPGKPSGKALAVVSGNPWAWVLCDRLDDALARAVLLYSEAVQARADDVASLGGPARNDGD